MLCDALIHLGKIKNDWSIIWNHFGGGNPDETDVINNKIKGFPSNIEANLWGNISNDAVIEFYRRTSVVFFDFCSSSEGLPVSMMEAISFGIPIISSNVGGVRELVTNDNGMLLPNNVSAEQIAISITNFISENKQVLNRQAAIDTWRDRFSAHTNYSSFATELSKLIN